MGIQPLMEPLSELFRRIDGSRDEMIRTWQSLVDRDCGSVNKAGVDALGKEIASFLKKLGFSIRFHHYEKAGDMLVAEYGDGNRPFVILTGHMDTVFADGTAARRPFAIKDGKAFGPGVLDMKGGVTILLHTVRLLIEAGYQRHPLKIILAGDEETGHAHSDAAKDYLAGSRGALMGFNMETGFMDNGIVVERKGVYQCRFDVRGIGAHAGNNPEDGRSAVRELCRKVLDLESLTDFKEGTTVNVGTFSGGTVANAVPEEAHCVVDVRFRSASALERIKKEFGTITEKVYTEGTVTVCTPIATAAAMERLPQSLSLFDRAEAAAEKYGLPPMKPIAVGGGSDSAYLAQAGVPVLCALGVKGQYNHTVREWADVSSLTERAKLLAVLLTEL